MNWLALYGAVVGTTALLVNFARYRHSTKSSKVSLSISVAKHRAHDENIQRLTETESEPEYGRPSIVSLYTITITNTGSIDAFIQNAGVITDTNVRKEALGYRNRNESILSPLPDLDDKLVRPKSSKNYDIHLKRGEELYTVKRAFVEDQTGNKWLSKKK